MAVFRAWQKIDDPQSVWRRRLVIDQIAPAKGHDSKRILEHLQRKGIMTEAQTEEQHEAQLATIRQDIARLPEVSIARETL